MMPRMILVVGRAGNRRTLIRAALEAEEYTVQEAASTADVLAIATRSRLDLVLFDLRPPHDDSFALTRLLRTLPGGSTLSIVAVVDTLADLAPDQLMEADFTDYLVSPLDWAYLLEIIHLHLPLR
jgi:CheY-like chemotaxis protein